MTGLRKTAFSVVFSKGKKGTDGIKTEKSLQPVRIFLLVTACDGRVHYSSFRQIPKFEMAPFVPSSPVGTARSLISRTIIEGTQKGLALFSFSRLGIHFVLDFLTEGRRPQI